MPDDSSLLKVVKTGKLTVVRFRQQSVPDEINLARVGDEAVAIVQEQNCNELAFDLTGMDYITSVVLGFFVGLRQHVDNVHLYNPTDFVLDILRKTKLDNILKVQTGWKSGLYSGEDLEDTALDSVAASVAVAAAETVKSPPAAMQQPKVAPTSDERPSHLQFRGQSASPAVPQDANNHSTDRVKDHVANEIRAFEGSVGEEYSVGIVLPNGVSFILENVTFRGTDLMIFAGRNPDGSPVQVVQYATQVSLVLTSVKRDDEDKTPRRRIGFLQKSIPSPQSVARS